MTNTEVFKKLVNENINRAGVSNLMHWLENETDFFEAPASTRYHGAYKGGLVSHCINVYNRLGRLYTEGYLDEAGGKVDWLEVSPKDIDETIAIVALFHDVCKANFYTVEMRNRKNDQGKWEKYPCYTIQDEFPAGHGEKSVMLIQRFMKLTDSEIMAINWHMGFSDNRAQTFAGINALGGAFEKYPLALLLHMADLMATYLDEGREAAWQTTLPLTK